MYTCMEIVSLW